MIPGGQRAHGSQVSQGARARVNPVLDEVVLAQR